MRFGLIQCALGATLLAWGPLAGGAAWLLAWPGLSVLAVGLAYLAGSPAIFGKDPVSGRLTAWKIALVFPYVAVAWGLWQLKSRLGREHPYDEVAPSILVGRRPLDRAELPPGARVVVDLTSELPRASCTAGVERYLCLPTLDTAAPSDDGFGALLDAVEGDPGPIFVHCAMGHGRSATFAAGLMIRRGHARDLDDALAQMKAARPGVHLHRGQRRAVERETLRRQERPGAPLGKVGADELAPHHPPEDRPDRSPDPA